MHVRVTPFRYDPSREADVVRLGEHDLIPFLRQLPGFRRVTVNLDRETGRGAFISEWDERQQAEAVRKAAGPDRVQRGVDAGIQMETSSVFEVMLQA